MIYFIFLSFFTDKIYYIMIFISTQIKGKYLISLQRMKSSTKVFPSIQLIPFILCWKFIYFIYSSIKYSTSYENYPKLLYKFFQNSLLRFLYPFSKKKGKIIFQINLRSLALHEYSTIIIKYKIQTLHFFSVTTFFIIFYFLSVLKIFF